MVEVAEVSKEVISRLAEDLAQSSRLDEGPYLFPFTEVADWQKACGAVAEIFTYLVDTYSLEDLAQYPFGPAADVIEEQVFEYADAWVVYSHDIWEFTRDTQGEWMAYDYEQFGFTDTIEMLAAAGMVRYYEHILMQAATQLADALKEHLAAAAE